MDGKDTREPLLGDNAMDQLYPLRARLGEGDVDVFDELAENIRDFYERLIDEGKLRVVEEAEVWHPTAPEEQWRKWLEGSDAEFSLLVTKCCGRNPWTPPWGIGKAYIDNGELKRGSHKFVCPGCGNPIRR